MTSRILRKKQLGENVFRMTLEAPLIAKERRAGQFIILRCDAEWGERIPLTIADADAKAGTIDIIFQSVGVSTKRLSLMSQGDVLPDLVGPLGKPTSIPQPPQPPPPNPMSSSSAAASASLRRIRSRRR